jgi:hypothetical protein
MGGQRAHGNVIGEHRQQARQIAAAYIARWPAPWAVADVIATRAGTRQRYSYTFLHETSASALLR